MIDKWHQLDPQTQQTLLAYVADCVVFEDASEVIERLDDAEEFATAAVLRKHSDILEYLATNMQMLLCKSLGTVSSRVVDVHWRDAHYLDRKDYIGQEGRWISDGAWKEEGYESGCMKFRNGTERYFMAILVVPATSLNRYVKLVVKDGRLGHMESFEAVNIQEAVNRIGCYPFDDADGVWPFQEALKYYLGEEDVALNDEDVCLLEIRSGDGVITTYPNRRTQEP